MPKSDTMAYGQNSAFSFGSKTTNDTTPTRDDLIAQTMNTRNDSARFITSTGGGGGGGGSTGSGSGSGGGGSYSGGGGGATSNKVYVNYYRRILGIEPNMKLVAKAVAGKYTLAEFQLLIQRSDTKRFLKTAKGQEAVSRFRDLYYKIFPGLGNQPGQKMLINYLRQKPTGKWNQVTNPTSVRDMYQYLAGTKQFKEIYGDFKGTKFEGNLDFAGYREYKSAFQQILKQYTGKDAQDSEVSYFFRSDIDPNSFEKNLTTVLGTKDAYQWASGGALGEQQAKEAMYGRKGGMQTLQKLAGALERQQNYMGAKTAQFDTQKNEFGKLEQNLY